MITLNEMEVNTTDYDEMIMRNDKRHKLLTASAFHENGSNKATSSAVCVYQISRQAGPENGKGPVLN